jgi:predicted secreted protein
MIRHLLPTPLAAVLVVAACSREPRAGSGEGTFRDTVAYTDTSTCTNPAETIRTAPGTEFRISLRANRSTGYQWVLVDSAALGPVRVVGTDYRVPRELRDRDGAGGTETWTFNAPAAGQATVSLIHLGPGESAPPRDTTRFRVVIE